MKLTNYIYLFLILIGISACSEDDLEPTVSTSIDVNNISSANDLEAVALGMYDRMSDYRYYGRDFILYGDLRSDNTYSSGFFGVSNMNMTNNSNFAYYTWLYMYQTIAYANIVINTNNNAITGDEKAINYYKGQAYAIRALVHFDLMKLYGQEHTGGALALPYMKAYASTNTEPARDSLDVYKKFIENDFESAVGLIPDDYETKAYITKAAVYGLQSRFYLYTKQWKKARDAAEQVITGDNFSIVTGDEYIKSWTIDAPANSIFELAYSASDRIFYETIGSSYSKDGYDNVRPLADLYDTYEDGDIRIDTNMFRVDNEVYRNVGKFPSINGDLNISLLRYEEVILNYAEALWRINSSDSDALKYLNMIPENRGAISLYTEVNEDNILLERRKELAFEGFRFYDLVRTGRGIPYVDPNQTYSSLGVAYGSYNLAFPIPENEMNANSNMVENDGY